MHARNKVSRRQLAGPAPHCATESSSPVWLFEVFTMPVIDLNDSRPIGRKEKQRSEDDNNARGKEH